MFAAKEEKAVTQSEEITPTKDSNQELSLEKMCQENFVRFRLMMG